MTKRFSKSFSTYSTWLKQANDTSYTKKMQRLHSLHPQASLPQLRGHARKGEKILSQLRRAEPRSIDWGLLRPREMASRERSFHAVRLMRKRGYSLTKASRIAGTTPDTVRRHTGAVKKEGSRWAPKSYDTVSREMRINEDGKEVWVRIKDSRHASTIGKYQNAVKLYLNTGDERYLKPFKNKRIRDSDGIYHTLETDPHALHEIQERRPNEEIYTIYRTSED